MIDDDHLRNLFRQESDEYLQRLDDGLLQLEAAPAGDALVEVLFRDAHSLKGAAHMLGLESVELLAHSLEDMLNSARNDPAVRCQEYVREMLRQLSDIREAVSEALTSSSTAPPAVTERKHFEEGAELAARTPVVLDAVRVDAARLDGLLNAVGELNVARQRVSRRLEEVESITELYEELRRELLGHLVQDRTGVSGVVERLHSLKTLLGHVRDGLDEDSGRLDRVGCELSEGVRTMRLLPLANIFRHFPRMVRELAMSLGKEVVLTIEGEDVEADKRILEDLRDPLMHLLRNAVDHGIESEDCRIRAGKPACGHIRVVARRALGMLEIGISDDGCGLDETALRDAVIERGVETAAGLAAMSAEQVRRLIFRSGVTTARRVTKVSGRGIGLDVVHSAIERMKGNIDLVSQPGRGLTVTLHLPVSLVTVRLLIVEIGSSPFGFPVEYVLGSRRIRPQDVIQLDGGEAILFGEQPVPLASLGDLLELPAGGRAAAPDVRQVVVLSTLQGCFALEVDSLLDEQEVVLKPAGALLEKVHNVAGATILESGAVCFVLSPAELILSIRRRAVSAALNGDECAPSRRRRVLLAEDSITTRTQESRILTAAGFDVTTAVDGLDALRKLAREAFDVLVTDVNMPHLDGLGLARRVRGDARYAELPIILVTSLASDEDRMRGLEAGANAYITKPGFDQRELIECLDRLI